MSGLVLRCAGPLQSWGVRSRLTFRDTAMRPTRSALIGCFASAMGVPRGEPLDRFASLTVSVRCDRPGTIIRDFHTAGAGPVRIVGANGSSGANPVLTTRHYLSDATFVVAVSSPDDLVDDIAVALANPVWQTFLGRRSCPPAEPFVVAFCGDDVHHRLIDAPVLTTRRRDESPRRVELVSETPGDHQFSTTVTDVPTVFARAGRGHGARVVHHRWLDVTADRCVGGDLAGIASLKEFFT